MISKFFGLLGYWQDAAHRQMAAVSPSTISQMCCKTAWPWDTLEDRYPFSHHLGTGNKDKRNLLSYIEIQVNIHQATVISHLVGYILENSKLILRFEVFVGVLLQMWHCAVGWQVTDSYWHSEESFLLPLHPNSSQTVGLWSCRHYDLSKHWQLCTFHTQHSSTSQHTWVFSNEFAVQA